MKKIVFASLLLGTLFGTGTAFAQTSKCILPAGFEFVEEPENCVYNEGLAPVSYGGKVGYTNVLGELVLPAVFDEGYGFDDGLALVKQGDKYGYINPKGSFVIKPKFEDAWGFWGGRAKFAKAGKFGFIDKVGKVIIAPKFDDAGNWFEDGLVAVKKDDKWGYIDTQGRTRVAFEYDIAKDFSEGMAVVGMATDELNAEGQPIYKYGYINTHGHLVIALGYDYASDFLGGQATVESEQRLIHINQQGKAIALLPDETLGSDSR